MTAPVRKYNPAFLTDAELVASYCVRTSELTSIVEALRESTGASNIHQIVIGPRGSGKTSLLLRVAAEIRGEESLSHRLLPIVFAEENYCVATVGEFWLECLHRVADQVPSIEGAPDLRRMVEELRTIQDDMVLADRCLGAIQDVADSAAKRLVLIVENLNMMFRDMPDANTAAWRLRHTLQTDPRIVLLASATSRFDQIDHPDRALYDLFRTLQLRPLNTEECATLWGAVSGQCRELGTVRSLEILTGGSPRLLAIVARFGGGLSFQDLMAQLLDLVDDHTEYFKSHLESLPAQERRVYLALAELWKPASTREIAEQARLDTSKCSAQLKRLVERGAVIVAGGSARRKLHYLAERLYNIYYLLRRGHGPDRLLEALVRFMASYYSLRELKDVGVRLVADISNASAEVTPLYQGTLTKLLALPELGEHRAELLAKAGEDLVKRVAPSDLVAGQAEEALTTYEVGRLRGTPTPELKRGLGLALLGKAYVELELRRFGQAIETSTQAIHACHGQALEEGLLNAHCIRALACLRDGTGESMYEGDVQAMLELLSQLDSIPSLVIEVLIVASIKLGAATVRDWILTSPAADQLLPLATALDQELGLETSVAQEVDEVAQDIRREFSELREAIE